jgi:GNAT superfamily N-acetyltransferase
MDELIFKKATKNDLSFVIDCIVGAEYSGSQILSYCVLFDLTENLFRELLVQFIDEEIEGQPWNLDHWFIGYLNVVQVCGGCCWIEAQNGIGSDMLKSQILQYFLPDKLKLKMEELKLISEITIPRIPDSIEVEYFFTHPEYRNRGLITSMIYFIDETFPNRNKEIIMVGNNVRAMELYKRHGYDVRETKTSTQKNILTLLPSDTKVALLKKI